MGPETKSILLVVKASALCSLAAGAKATARERPPWAKLCNGLMHRERQAGASELFGAKMRNELGELGTAKASREERDKFKTL